MTRLLVFVGIVLVLIYGNLVYQVARLGYFLRRRRHRPARLQDVVDATWDTAPAIVVLVPAYKEDPRTIRQTLLSAALQHYPNRRVALLLDDPPHPTDPSDAARLAAARRVPTEIAGLLAAPAARTELAAVAFGGRRTGRRRSPAGAAAAVGPLRRRRCVVRTASRRDAARGPHRRTLRVPHLSRP